MLEPGRNASRQTIVRGSIRQTYQKPEKTPSALRSVFVRGSRRFCHVDEPQDANQEMTN